MKHKNAPEKMTCTEPEYVGKFRCDASKCDAFCCQAHWGIEIDRGTYQKYQKITPKRKRQAILAHLKYQPEANNYRALSDDGKYCYFLNAEHLCSLQKEHGEDFLSDTCITFPRRLNRIDNVIERGLLLSCPVAAELALLSGEPIKFVERETNADERLLIMDTLSSAANSQAVDFIAVQRHCVDILQDKSRPIDERLARLGFYLSQGEYAPPKFAPEEYRQNITHIIDSVYRAEEGFTQRHRELLAASNNEDFANIRTASRRLLQRQGQPWENYLVNEFFLMLYPFRIKDSMLLSYELYIAAAKLAEFMVTAYVLSHDGEDTEERLLMRAVSIMSRLLDHNNDYVEKLALSAVRLNIEPVLFMNGYLDVG